MPRAYKMACGQTTEEWRLAEQVGPSEETLAFLAQERPEIPPLTCENAHLYRASFRMEALPRADQAVARHPVEVAEKVIADVPCLIVTPKSWDGAREAVYCYGGGYFSGSAREDLILAAPLAAYSGSRITLMDYRLAPEHPFPAAAEDGMAVYRALASRGPFRLIGESAGGNLALLLLLRALDQGLPLPERVALLSPWCDLTPDGVSIDPPDGDDPTLSPELSRAAASLYAGGRVLADPEISPLFAEWPSGLPPVLMTTGTRDLLREQVLRLAERLQAAGNRCDVRVHPHMWHVFEFYDEIPEADLSLREIGAYLRLRDA